MEGFNLSTEEIQRIIQQTLPYQADDGSFRFCFENGILTDAYTIILLRMLEYPYDGLIEQLVDRLWKKQTEDGTWKWYDDEGEGNVSATIEAYFALRYAGISPSHPKLRLAEQFIRKEGGINQAHTLTKVMLAMNGQYDWSKEWTVPIEVLLLPDWSPFQFQDLVSSARVHIAPILVCANQHFSITTNETPNIRPILGSTTFRSFDEVIDFFEQAVSHLLLLPSELHQKALKTAEQYLLQRIEPDGTLYSYFSATFFMVYALLALGYSKDNPVIVKAVDGLIEFICHPDETIHVQNSTSTVWDTALMSSAYQQARVSPWHDSLRRAARYLLLHQQTKYGDWVDRNPDVRPGGWGFSDSNTINPDNDDSVAALTALYPYQTDANYRDAWLRGAHWLESMQNDDGGFSAFNKNTDSEWVTLLPYDGAKYGFSDPSTADLTGRVLSFLCIYRKKTLQHRSVKSAVRWLLQHQERNGSWYGRWGICYIYGTWAALKGLRAAGVPGSHTAIQRGVRWLLSIQNEDGGWGESCRSDHEKQFCPLGVSTPSQTAWALDALLTCLDINDRSIQHGIKALINLNHVNDWRTKYPTGAALPGGFYIHYHSYRYVWPLLTLAHYERNRNKNA
jgi:sporulenol synthase